MHPILSNRLRLGLYLASWLVIGLLFAAILRVVSGRPLAGAAIETIPAALIFAFICLSAWWVCRAAPLGRTPALRIVAALLGAALFSGIVWAVLAGVWARVADAVIAGSPALAALAGAETWTDEGPGGVVARRAQSFSLYSIAGVPLYLFSAAVHYLIDAFESSRAAERVALEAQVVARDAELRALRAQLNPHFLFNSLNSINALVGSDPEAARRMCERLGDFLRRTLALAARQSVPLAEEIVLVERYLGIEEVRFGARLRRAIAVSEEAARCAVPPLVLQPLVENAVKHGVSGRLEGGEIRVEADVIRRAGDGVDPRGAERILRIRVVNPADDDPAPRPGAGVGLDNVRRRLHTIAPRYARLTAAREAGEFRVEVLLPAVDASAEAAPAAIATPSGSLA
jgi:ABC-type amino acid transport substrate-binding protein